MKKYIIGFVLGIIVCGSIGTVVALNYNAKNVSYTPSDENWNVNNVEDAIKDLKVFKDIGDFSETNFGETLFHNNCGNGSLKTTSLELEPGNYILNIVVADAYGSSDSTTYNRTEDNGMSINCDGDCSYKKMNNRYLSYRYATNANTRAQAVGSLYLVNIKSKKTISASYDSRTSNNSTHTVSMYMTANRIN